MANERRDDVTVLKVDPTVWAEALKLAEGNSRRIEIRGEFDVVVHNDSLPASRRVSASTYDHARDV